MYIDLGLLAASVFMILLVLENNKNKNFPGSKPPKIIDNSRCIIELLLITRLKKVMD